MSDKGDPTRKEYYQSLGDLIKIYWEIQRRRLDDPDDPAHLAYSFNTKEEGMTPFNSGKDMEIDKTPNSYEVIYEFMNAVDMSITGHWFQFMYDAGHSKKRVESFSRLGARYKVVALADHTQNLIEKTTLLCSRLPEVERHGNYPIDEIVASGLSTAALVGVQTISLSPALGKNSNPEIMALMLSKVDLNQADEAVSRIGYSGCPFSQQTYKLLDPNSKFALDIKQLKEFGYGMAIGCPASLKTSIETVQFLQKELGGNVSREPMLIDFMRRLSKEYKQSIVEWYNGCDETTRSYLRNPTRDILEGRLGNPLENKRLIRIKF